MKLSDMVGRNQTPNGNDPLDRRKFEPVASLSEKLLSQSHAADERESTDLISGLVDRLPKPDGTWPLDDRVKWLRAAVSIFDLVYKSGEGEHRNIRIALDIQQSPNRLAPLSADPSS